MNTVEITAADGGTVRVTIRSSGERDLSATVNSAFELRQMIDAAEASRPGENPEPTAASQETPLEQD
jgi:hypothetical protein